MIPNIIHFCFDNKFSEGFSFTNCLSILSANSIHNPDKIYFYCYNVPYGEFWEKIKDLVNIQFINEEENIESILIKNLLEKGGVLISLDSITTNSYNKFLKHSCVLTFSDRSRTKISKSIIMSEPYSEFLKIWYIIHKFYNGQIYDIPTQLIYHKILDIKKVSIFNNTCIINLNPYKHLDMNFIKKNRILYKIVKNISF